MILLPVKQHSAGAVLLPSQPPSDATTYSAHHFSAASSSSSSDTTKSSADGESMLPSKPRKVIPPQAPYKDILFDPFDEKPSAESLSSGTSDYYYYKTLYRKQMHRAWNMGVEFDSLAQKKRQSERERDLRMQEQKLQMRAARREEEARKEETAMESARELVKAKAPPRASDLRPLIDSKEHELDERMQRLNALMKKSLPTVATPDPSTPAGQGHADDPSRELTEEELAADLQKYLLVKQDLEKEAQELQQRMARVDAKILEYQQRLAEKRPTPPSEGEAESADQVAQNDGGGGGGEVTNTAARPPSGSTGKSAEDIGQYQSLLYDD